ncbi:MAG TPA: dephospho-CoA kinase [Steroidobacteraceae bacterium]|jgi:dephospho-CoA kinase|nr:dephospho-CoA kinase [Steroidobacteraceae bacterium]
MGRRLLIGLTGGIASGKSTVAQRFTERGVPVIDADASARAVVAPGNPGLEQVIKRFGPSVVAENGELDRRALRGRIFSDADARRDLEAILHPLIRTDMERGAAAAEGPYVVMAIPLLVEGAVRNRVDRILVVDVDEAVQLRRVMARDHCSLEEARAIVASQAPRSARLAAADDVLPNSGTVTDLRQAVDRLHETYLRLADAQRAE